MSKHRTVSEMLMEASMKFNRANVGGENQMAKSKGTAKPRKPVTVETAVLKLAVMLAPFSAADQKKIVSGSRKMLKLTSKLASSNGAK